MRTASKARIILVMFAMSLSAISGAQGVCKLCESGSQDAVARTVATFLGDAPLNSTPEYTTTGGLINPKISRQSYASEGSASQDRDSKSEVSDESQGAEGGQVAAGQRSRGLQSILAPVAEVDGSGAILIDVTPNPQRLIPGAISIPCTRFFNESGRTLPSRELARVFGDAGVSRDDEVLICGQCQDCGKGPSASAYVYWVLKYLGHEKARVLDGGIEDWMAENRTAATEPRVLPAANYTVSLQPDLLATSDLVQSGKVQLVDARTMQEYGSGSIPGSLNIPEASVIEGGRLKDEAKLQRSFSILNKDQPVVVYASTDARGSAVWLALVLLGYDARLYSYEDWLTNNRNQGK